MAVNRRYLKKGKELYLMIYPESERLDLKSLFGGIPFKEILNSTYILVVVNEEEILKVGKETIYPMLEYYRTSEGEFADQVRDNTSRDFGFDVMEWNSHTSIAIRLPVEGLKDIEDHHGNVLMSKLIKVTKERNIGNIVAVFIVADEGHLRLNPSDFFKGLFKHGKIEQKAIEALKKQFSAQDYTIHQDVDYPDGSGIYYPLDLVGVNQEGKSLALKAMKSPTPGWIELLSLLKDDIGFDKVILLTEESQVKGIDPGVEILSIFDVDYE